MNPEIFIVRFPEVQYHRASDSYIIPHKYVPEVVAFLKEHPDFRLDMCTCCTAVDWLPETNVTKRKVIENIDGKVVERIEEVIEEKPQFLETVYHLVSVEKKHGPFVIRIRTKDREDTRVPSLTPYYRGCELQEREGFDLFGIYYEGHPDLRRIFMWEGFKDFPMRKDYVEPDDYEYEPTPHDEVLQKAKRHYPSPTP
ncbi:MAG: NADH-quinone oxidoreductase subunit C [Verrucomicrobiae bacterium]|nr:NADH-quinone oxidoreductase subunit C [Verrucomicrobiae bacterium]